MIRTQSRQTPPMTGILSREKVAMIRTRLRRAMSRTQSQPRLLRIKSLSPAKAPEHALATSPATPAQAEQQQLEKDSATLLRLVQELKAEVEKAGSNTLSLAALRKADEIQRLAKNLKEKMKEQGQTFQNKP
jgi:hypothetical protein